MPAEGDTRQQKVKLGQRLYALGDGKVGELRDSSAARSDPATLRQHLADDGYLFLRGVIPQDVVQQGRLTVLKHLDAQDLVDRSHPLQEAVAKGSHNGDQGRVKGTENLIRTEEFLAVVEHPALFSLLADLRGEPCSTLDYKWLRAVKPGESSGFHMDWVYMGRGSSNLLTCWIPFCDVPLDKGGLALLRGSHRSDGYKRVRDTYGELDLDRDDVGGTGWFTEDPEEALHFGGCFDTAHFHPGDVVLFPMKTMHGSSVNQTDRWRISADVRFQPKSDPLDLRWIFDADGAIQGLQSRWVVHRDDKKIFPRTIEDAKRDWGIHWQDLKETEEPPEKRMRQE